MHLTLMDSLIIVMSDPQPPAFAKRVNPVEQTSFPAEKERFRNEIYEIVHNRDKAQQIAQ
jgi:hypothetical protein